MSLSSANSTCAVPWLATSRTTTGRALTCRSTRMRPTAGQLSSRNSAGLSRFAKSVASTIATSDGRPDAAQPVHHAGDSRVRPPPTLGPFLRWWASGSRPQAVGRAISDSLSRVPGRALPCREGTGRRQQSGMRFWRRTGSPLSNITDVLNGLSSASLWQERVYKDLHAHPELSFHEIRTAALAAAKLKELGYEVLEQIGHTGVVGVLRNGTGQTVLARADMDALPVKERTGLPYASTLTATDDTGASVPVMHACGHDAHVTCLLGAAELLARARRSWSGTFIAVFQPAEEVAGGAKTMLKDGLRDRIPKPDVAFAQHVLAYPAGTVGTHVGPVLSAGDSIRITLQGKGAHGSMPHNSVDPVVLAALVVLRLQTIVSRETKPGEFAVLTVGSSVAGTKSNIIPDHAVLLAICGPTICRYASG